MVADGDLSCLRVSACHLLLCYMPQDQLHCLQGVYRAFIRNAKFMTQSSAPDVAFVGSCVVEMFGLDLVRAYEHAFTYIKQLAALLRGAMSSQSTDAYREIYCWQTVSTLELWCKLLAAHHDKEVQSLRILCSRFHPAQAQPFQEPPIMARSMPVQMQRGLHTATSQLQVQPGMRTRANVASTALLCRSCDRWCTRCARSSWVG